MCTDLHTHADLQLFLPAQTTAGATTYGETGVVGGHHHAGHHTAGTTYTEGEVVGERPMAVGVAEVS